MDTIYLHKSKYHKKYLVMNIPEEGTIWRKVQKKESSRSSQRTSGLVCLYHKESVKEKWEIN